MQSQKQQNELCLFPRQRKVKGGRFYEDLQDLLEITPEKYVIFILGDWNAKVGSKETPGVTGKFGLGVQNEAGQRLTDFLTMMVIRGVYLDICMSLISVLTIW